ERRASRQVAGCECEGRGGGPAWLVRHRQRRVGYQGCAVLGLRRRSTGLGGLEDAGKRGQDLLIALCSPRATTIWRPAVPAFQSQNNIKEEYLASQKCWP